MGEREVPTRNGHGLRRLRGVSIPLVSTSLILKKGIPIWVENVLLLLEKVRGRLSPGIPYHSIWKAIDSLSYEGVKDFFRRMRSLVTQRYPFEC